MFEAKEVQQEVYEFLMEFAATSDKVGYCDNCPLLHYESDTGAYDCEYGGDVESCEHSPSNEIQRLAEKYWEVVTYCKP